VEQCRGVFVQECPLAVFLDARQRHLDNRPLIRCNAGIDTFLLALKKERLVRVCFSTSLGKPRNKCSKLLKKSFKPNQGNSTIFEHCSGLALVRTLQWRSRCCCRSWLHCRFLYTCLGLEAEVILRQIERDRSEMRASANKSPCSQLSRSDTCATEKEIDSGR
jgi:hypothetical protein